MAITFLQGTLNPSSTQKAKDLRQAWVNAFTGISGWTIVDDNYVNGTSERSVLVNSAGFAIMLWHSTTYSNINLYFVLGKTYDVGTHTMNNIGLGAKASYTTDVTLNSEGFSTFSFNPTGSNSPNSMHDTHFFDTLSGQTNWAATIESTYAILSIKTSTAGVSSAYIGEYDNLMLNSTLTNVKPYGVFWNTSEFGINLNSSSNENWVVAVNGFQWEASPVIFSLPQAGAPADVTYADLYGLYPTLSRVSPIYVSRRQRNPNNITENANTRGWLQGKLKSVIYANPSNASWGDTVTVDGKTYYYAGGAVDYAFWVERT